MTTTVTQEGMDDAMPDHFAAILTEHLPVGWTVKCVGGRLHFTNPAGDGGYDVPMEAKAVNAVLKTIEEKS